jgi:hypothetical protein
VALLLVATGLLALSVKKTVEAFREPHWGKPGGGS